MMLALLLYRVPHGVSYIIRPRLLPPPIAETGWNRLTFALDLGQSLQMQ